MLCSEPSQIATVTNCDTTVAICDLSQFVIKAVTAQTGSNDAKNLFWVLGGVLRFTFDINMKSCIFAQFGVISLVYMFMCMHISYKAYNRCAQEISWRCRILMWICFLNLGVYLRLLLISIWEVVFWTVTNCDSHKLRHYRGNFCDLSQFLIKALTAQTESNTTEYVFWVLGRAPRFTFDITMKSCIFAHFGVISLIYLFMCMHIIYKAYNRCTQEIAWKGSILMWACFLN